MHASAQHSAHTSTQAYTHTHTLTHPRARAHTHTRARARAGAPVTPHAHRCVSTLHAHPRAPPTAPARTHRRARPPQITRDVPPARPLDARSRPSQPTPRRARSIATHTCADTHGGSDSLPRRQLHPSRPPRPPPARAHTHTHTHTHAHTRTRTHAHQMCVSAAGLGSAMAGFANSYCYNGLGVLKASTCPIVPTR